MKRGEMGIKKKNIFFYFLARYLFINETLFTLEDVLYRYIYLTHIAEEIRW